MSVGALEQSGRLVGCQRVNSVKLEQECQPEYDGQANDIECTLGYDGSHQFIGGYLLITGK